MDKRFQWTEFYMELASALLPYKNNRSDLIAKLKTIFADAGMNFPFKERGKEVYEDICPFTVFGSFNKGITNANRIALLEQFAKQFSIKAAVPTEFDGIPVVMNLSAWFFAYKENRGEHDIDNLWDLLEKAIAYSDEASTDNKNAFIAAYDTVTKQKMIKWNITMGLYWARPYTFINLDSTNRAFITDVDNMPHYFTTIFSDINKGLPDGRNYLFMCEQAKNALNQKEYEYHSFPELSYYAWKSNQLGKTEETTTTTVDSNIKETNYWIYSPGDNASMWDEFYKSGIMGIGWDDVTDLKGFSSKEEIKDFMKKVYDPSYSYKNNAHCLWQFANEIKVGDVIFVKKGMHKIIGKGIVTSDYIYDTSRSTYKHTRYDSTAKKSIPYSWTLRWGLYTNAPHGNQREKIAGQDRKVFANREELDRYLNGRIKAHDHYFTEISPAIPKEYADCFKVNGCLLPGYTIEGEEPTKTAELPTQEEAAQPQTAATPERREPVNEIFSIFLDNRAEAQTGGPHGYWLSLPTSAEQVQEALKEIHITANNQQDLFIGGFSAPEGKPLELPEDLIKAASVDELNFLAAQLQKLDVVELAELNAAMQSPAKMQTIGQLLDYAENTDCFVLINAKDNRSLGEYYLNDSGLFVVPDPWKPAIDTDRLGSFIANEEQGTFTDYGYILRTSDEWQRVHEGQPVPEEYRVMAYPAPEILRDESKVQPEAAAPTKAPQPVTPILLNGQNSAERMKEITDRLETGIQELFESERYKAYLTTMSKFHSYSFNNTLLIAMQGGQLVAGYNKWRDDFHRNVKKGEKAIKILAPAPFKAKKEVQKLDAQGRPVMGKDGKPVTEVQEIQVPAFKIVSVFDVSQTEGEPLPSIGVEELTGSVERYGEFFKALEQTSPVPIGFEDIPGGSHGYYHLTEKRIAIQEGMSELQTLAERCERFRYCCIVGCQNDKRRVETSGGATGVGGTNPGMPQQRSLRKRMVPAARCYNNTPGKFLRHPSFFCGSSNPAK